mmetsp:Transcript_79251/g.181536  ORF Transcript_79251/g.181536 Transcript_79251/m.181536 type:complete len:371 (+) Transcript_79251:4031-5143(+)
MTVLGVRRLFLSVSGDHRPLQALLLARRHAHGGAAGRTVFRIVVRELASVITDELPLQAVVSNHELGKRVVPSLREAVLDRAVYEVCCTRWECVQTAAHLVLLLKLLSRREEAEQTRRQFLAQSGACEIHWTSIDSLHLQFGFAGRDMASAIWDSANLPIAQYLAQHAAPISREVEGALLHPDLLWASGRPRSWTNCTRHLWLLNDGNWNEPLCRLLPSVCPFLRSRWELNGTVVDRSESAAHRYEYTSAGITLLGPLCRLGPRFGQHWVVRHQLAASVGQGFASTTVWNSSFSWETGLVLSFDESAEHAVQNDGVTQLLLFEVQQLHPAVLSRRAVDPDFESHFDSSTSGEHRSELCTMLAFSWDTLRR